MSRPNKIGLDYFPLDVNIDDNLELIEAEFNLIGFAIVIKLWQKIYSKGYYIDWDKDEILLFSRRINTELNIVNSVVNSCLLRNIFSEKLFVKYKILTSSGIQKRYILACSQSKRKNIEFITEFTLVNSEFIKLITEFSTQSKVKEIKEEEIKKGTEKFLNFQLVVSLFDSKFYNEKTWVDCYDKLIRIDGYTEDRLLEIISEFRTDGNWWKDNGNFESLLKLREKDKQGIKYIDLFNKKSIKQPKKSEWKEKTLPAI